MAIKLIFKDKQFSIGDEINVIQTVKEGEKERLQRFSGILIAIKGRGNNKSFTVRRIGANKVGIERIFPVESPILKDIEPVRSGGRGVRHAKLYYIREKSRKQIEKVYQRASRKSQPENETKQSLEKPQKKSAKKSTKSSPTSKNKK